MHRFITALSIALGLMSPALAADEVEMPPDLIGGYGINEGDCRAYHRKDTDPFWIVKFGMGDGPLDSPSGGLVSFKKTPRGYRFVIKVTELAGLFPDPSRDKEFIRTVYLSSLRNGDIKIAYNGKTFDLRRCTPADIKAGVGRVTKSFPSLFEPLEQRLLRAGDNRLLPEPSCERGCFRRRAKGTEALRGHWRRKPSIASRKGLDWAVGHDDQETQHNAREAVRLDAFGVDQFCDEAMKAFGDKGRVIPGLLKGAS